MNFRKIYEADTKQPQQQPHQGQQQLDGQTILGYATSLFDTAKSIFNSMSILHFIKAHYINKAAGASNVANANNQMVHTATGQNPTNANLQEVESAFTKYEDFGTKIIGECIKFKDLLANLKVEVLKEYASEIDEFSDCIFKLQGAIQAESQAFHNENTFKGLVNSNQQSQQQQQQNTQPQTQTKPVQQQIEQK